MARTKAIDKFTAESARAGSIALRNAAGCVRDGIEAGANTRDAMLYICHKPEAINYAIALGLIVEQADGTFTQGRTVQQVIDAAIADRHCELPISVCLQLHSVDPPADEPEQREEKPRLAHIPPPPVIEGLTLKNADRVEKDQYWFLVGSEADCKIAAARLEEYGVDVFPQPNGKTGNNFFLIVPLWVTGAVVAGLTEETEEYRNVS